MMRFFLPGERYSPAYLRWAVASDGRQDLNPAHLPLFTDGTGCDIDPADPEHLFLPCFLPYGFSWYGCATAEDFEAYRDRVFVSVRQEAEVSYPHIAGRQDMEEEPSDKLLCCERHGLLTVVIGVISPKERDSAVPEGKDAVITDRRSMGIPAEILQDTHGAIERRFAIHDPLLMIELSPECLEGAGLFEMTDSAGEDKITCCEALFEEIEELASEQRRHDPYGEEEAFAAGNPAAPVG